MSTWKLVDKTIAHLALEKNITTTEAEDIIGFSMDEDVVCLVRANDTIVQILHQPHEIVEELNRLKILNYELMQKT